MGKRPKQTFLQGRHTEVNKHMKRCSTLLFIRKMHIKTTMRYDLALVRMAIIKKSTNSKGWRGCKGKGTLWYYSVQFSSVAQSCLTLCNPMQHTRPPYPSPAPGVYQNSHPLSWWGHPTISSSVIPFSSCPQSLPASESFQWVSSSHQVAKVLEFQLQHWSFNWTPRTDLL